MTATPELRTDHTEKSTAELVRDLTEQVSRLARTEVTLAVREMKGKAKHAGVGAAFAGAGGVFAFYGGAVLIARKQLKQSAPMPSPAVESAKEDIHAVKEARKR